MSRIGGIGGSSGGGSSGGGVGGPPRPSVTSPRGRPQGRPHGPGAAAARAHQARQAAAQEPVPEPLPWAVPSLAEEPDGVFNRALAMRVMAMDADGIKAGCRIALRIDGGGLVVIDHAPAVSLHGRIVGLTSITAEKLMVQTDSVLAPEAILGRHVWAVEVLFGGVPFYRCRSSLDVPDGEGIHYRFGANVSL